MVNRYSLYFILLWIFALIIYPLWLPFSTTEIRLAVFLLLIILVILSSKLVLKWIKNRKEDERKFNIKDKFMRIFILASFIFFILEIPLMAMDLPPLSDESFHIARGLWLVEPLISAFSNAGIDFFMAFRILFMLAVFSLFMFKDRITEILTRKIKRKKAIILFLSAAAYFLIINFLAVKFHTIKYGTPEIGHLNWMVYYGPISNIIYSASFSLFGFLELGMRIIQPIFMILAAFYLYRTVNLFSNKKTSLITSILFLFSPIIMYFGGLSYLESGLLFFITASSFYFLRSRMENNFLDIAKCFFLVSAGYLYKQPILFMLAVMAAYIIIEEIIFERFSIKKLFKKNIDYLKGALFSLVIIGPWIIINQIFDTRHIGDLSVFSNWLSINKILIYYNLIPRQTNIFLWIFFTFGLVYALISIFKNRKESRFYLYLASWFFIWYAIHVSYLIIEYRPIRITLPLIPAVIALSVVPVFSLLNRKIKQKKIVTWIFIILIVFTIFNTVSLAYTEKERRYVPIDDMFRYIKYNIDEKETILATTAPNPYFFYIEKYKIKNKFVDEIWTPYKDQNEDNLYYYMKSNNIEYAMFIIPKPNYYDFHPSGSTWIDYYGDCEGRDRQQEVKGATTPCPLNIDLISSLENGSRKFKVDYASNNGFNRMILLKTS